MYREYKDRAAFLFVYVHEAHAEDEWAMDDNRQEGISVPQPKTAAERQSVASTCCSALKFSMPCVVDSMDNRVDEAYAGWPERMFVIDGRGRIAYAGRQGPWGFKPDEVRQWLKRNLPKSGS